MTTPGNRFLARLPLFAAFALMPLAVLAGRLAGRSEAFRAYGPQGLALWLSLAGLALAVCLGRSVRAETRQHRPAWPGLALAAVLGAAVLAELRYLSPALSQAQNLAPLLDELHLPALALFAAAWVWSFGAPPREDLARLGGGLGALVLLDFLLTAIMARQVVLGGGLLLGGGQAGADTLAFLLCLALAAALDRAEAHQLRLSRWLILAGLLATFSRAGLAAAGLILLVLERGPLRERLALACACVLAIWMSLALPLSRPLTGSDELDLAWHLSATLEALTQNPGAWLTGLPLSEPMALALPDAQDLGGLDWDPESSGLPISVYDIPSSGLRLLAAWGAPGPLLVLAALLACALRSARRGRRRFGLGLLIATLPAAALTPVLHTPATAGALALACALAWADTSAETPGQGPERPPAAGCAD